MTVVEESYDVVIVGAGHAGCEAALACARLGLETIVFTISVDAIAMMPCNPNIGGTSKGHLVRELDALGGEMGKNIDKTFIQSKMLNASKGPAVHSLRAQADKQAYSNAMRKVMENTDHLTIRQGEVTELIIENKKCVGVKTFSGAIYRAKAVVLATGVYLRSRCIYGEISEETGPNGLKNAKYLTQSLMDAGIKMYRFKTGTPARVDARSIDFSKMEEQRGDVPVVPFSFTTDPKSVQKEQISCWLTYTGSKTHEMIRENIHRSPLFSGMIEGTGPRYCPSIEDKVMKFADKDRHQIFVEPEGLYTHEMYLGGMSSSLPEDVQYAMIHSVPGLENAKIVRNAYAIEYDCIDARQLKLSLEFREIEGLFSGGQFNGSSGYEEAAVQGFMAGVNAAMKIQEKEPVIIDRSLAYIGVLIDDLVTKGTNEPYRMMTSRSEYRLILRQDNADMRLTEKGRELGLVTDERYAAFCKKKEEVDELLSVLKKLSVTPTTRTNELLESVGSAPLKTGIKGVDLLRRQEMTYSLMKKLFSELKDYPLDVTEEVEITVKYEGYIERQREQVAKMNKLEQRLLPDSIDYEAIDTISSEGRQKLSDIRPRSLGQASRISGVSPADITALLIYTEQMRREGKGNVSM